MASKTRVMLSLALSLALLLVSVDAQLSIGYYSKTCPNAEAIVLDEMTKVIKVAPSLAGPLLRMHFHDCFVRGCDASVLLNSTNGVAAEKDARPNLSLRGYGVIDRVKARLEKACPGVVSCADILALVARDVVVLSKGRFWPVPTGRKDGLVSIANETRQLPPAAANITTLISMFAANGLSVKDLVVLSGGHTIGISHCVSFNARLYNFTGKANQADVDPTLDKYYLAKLRTICKPNDRVTFVEMDPGSFRTFDTSYYKLVAKRRGLFHSDQALLDHPLTKAYVLKHAGASEEGFFKDFGDSMISMGNVGVLTGTAAMDVRVCARFFFPVALLSFLLGSSNGHYLKFGFYKMSCPEAEAIVRKTVASYLYQDRTVAAPLLRMHFHDCFVRGCDGSVLLNSTNTNTAEKDAMPNQTLDGFYVIDAAKALLEKACPGTVSCADIVALAARDAVSLAAGRGSNLYEVLTGRRDGVVSMASEAVANLPSPNEGFASLKADFASKGLSVKDLVVLSDI
ncbi:Peroxidase [Canna indica]|uniref:Peroxidase 1 n=1 Tax=Canna indica TaxID=4628 RepID=A0AAQ3QKY8_9LILI|nr:Peroxidase [Canna indica]